MKKLLPCLAALIAVNPAFGFSLDSHASEINAPGSTFVSGGGPSPGPRLCVTGLALNPQECAQGTSLSTLSKTTDKAPPPLGY